MIRAVLVSLILIISLMTTALSQNVNLIIQVNEKIAVTELANIHIVFDSVDNRKQFDVNYVPGELIISDYVWTKINSDSASKFFLKFDYYTYTKDEQKIANFFVELTRFELKQPYLILNIYDFRDKKYKHWYQWITDKEFLSEFRFPNSGIYIRKR
jgi:hypothetical protein